MAHDVGDTASSAVRRWQLTQTLRQLREEAGLTVEEAADRLRSGSGKWSKSKVSRIENRDQGVRPREVEQMLDAYSVGDDDLRGRLVDLAESANERGWWLAHRKNLPDDFYRYLSMEAELVALRQFEPALIPGLLQTSDFMRALVQGVHAAMSDEEVERRVAARLARQRLLTRESPPELHFILDEAILRRGIGRAPVMRHQLQRLAQLAAEPNVTVQILPLTSGAHPGLEGPFSILSLPSPLPDVVYSEGVSGSVYTESGEHVGYCKMRFGVLSERALSAGDSVDLLLETAGAYE